MKTMYFDGDVTCYPMILRDNKTLIQKETKKTDDRIIRKNIDAMSIADNIITMSYKPIPYIAKGTLFNNIG